ncbi:MAG: tetratricopeptide repeat protein [Burkholderiales bacterium]|nr:tetratricopeptide repeat protein [Burkholderiales bacterium]
MTLTSALFRALCWAVLAIVWGCAQLPAGDAAQNDAVKAQATAKPAPELPAQELTPQLLYEHLLAEMALQRQEYGVAARAYVDLARKTRDPRIARRATNVALHARQAALAVEAATIWLQAEPDSLPARQTLASILISSGALEDVRPHLEMLLAADPLQSAQVFLQMNAMLGRHTDKAGVAKLVSELAHSHPKLPEAQLATAQAYWNAEQADAALAATQRALKLRPDWELAALFQAQVLQRRSSAEAIAFSSGYVEAHPDAKDMRLNLSRLLVAEHKHDEARRQIEALVRAHPQDPDVAVTVGLLAVQMNDWTLAETHLRRALDLNPGGVDTVRFYLGQVSEERKQPEAALRWYQAVAGGDQYIPAQGRIAGIMAKQGKLAEARATLQAIEPQSIQQRVQLTQAEAGILRDANAHKDAFDLLTQAVEKLPNVPDLLYDYAMAAEKVDRLDVLESNLRKLIELRPEHAHAYNALGYTLADRTDRLQEAHALIDRALKLAPDDPFIQDSMGWVLYRMGRIDEGHRYLEKAFKRRPDPEIAAHLGEVLWVQGRRDEAQRIWRSSLEEHPGNESLQAVIKKFLP